MKAFEITPSKRLEICKDLHIEIAADLFEESIFKGILRDSEILNIFTQWDKQSVNLNIYEGGNVLLFHMNRISGQFTLSYNEWSLMMQRLTAKYKYEGAGSWFHCKQILVAPQEYYVKPTQLITVRGASSRTIYLHMIGKHNDSNIFAPMDCKDYERNRALLLCYPEWLTRMNEMAKYSIHWKLLSQHWTLISELYNMNKCLCNQLLEKLQRDADCGGIYETPPMDSKVLLYPCTASVFEYMKFNMKDFLSTPQNVEQLNDIHHLLYHYPEWSSRLVEMTSLSKQWKQVVSSWDLLNKARKENTELCNLLLKEFNK